MELVFIKEVKIKDVLDNEVKLVRYKVSKYEVEMKYVNGKLDMVLFFDNWDYDEEERRYLPCIETDFDYFKGKMKKCKDKTKMFKMDIMEWRFMKIKDMEKAIENCQEAIEVVKVVSEFIDNNRNTD